MDVQIRRITQAELEPFLLASELASGVVPDRNEIERERSIAEPDRNFAAFDGPDIVGTAGAFTMPMTVPGAELVVGYPTLVGVLPTHRRRGIAAGLMRALLDDARERGEMLSVLYASEGGIYGRYGFGLGTIGLTLRIETARSTFVRGYEPSGQIRLVERERATKEILAVHEASRLGVPGMVHLDERRLAYVIGHEHGADKERPSFFALHEGGSGVDGYVIYKVAHDWPEGAPNSTLHVRDLVAANPGAYADLWRFVLDVDLVAYVDAANRPSDEPLFHLLREPRRLRARMSDNLWVRLVDVRGALGARRYGARGRLVLEIADAFCPWNQGRFALDVSSGDAGVAEPTTEPADLACTVNEVAATYLGGTSFRQLHRAGRVHEVTAVALARADAMFGCDPAPWSPYEF
ncbi:MAG TPA: GNAT family N-acetyltransferase [Actinomycetota bacterium]|nr:GNAT family N-acetyltransferase [Actinomycetota bacterium]